MHHEREQLMRIAAGDQAALKALYDVYYGRLARFLLRVTRDEALVAEVINDVFLVVWQRAATFRAESSVSTWILGIAYRMAARAAGRQRRAADLDAATPRDDDPVERIAMRRDLDQALALLSPEQRAVVELTYYFGYSYAEICDILDCPENTVKTRMFHARRRLRGIMEIASDG